MSELSTSLVSVVVGFVLGQGASHISRRFERRRQRDSARRLIALETGANLDLLLEYWHNVILEPDEVKEEESEADRYTRRALEIPFPTGVDDAWLCQLGDLPEFLSREELTAAWHFYNDISKIGALRHKLELVCLEDAPSHRFGYSRSSGALTGQGLMSATFTSESAALVFELRHAIEAILASGRPIAA